MKVYKGLKSVKNPIKGSVLSVGVFDGVHVGHSKIVTSVVRRARQLGAKSIVLTFDPHPLKLIHPAIKVPSLISLDHRMRLIGELGVDIAVVLKFTRSISDMPAEGFVKDILIKRFGMKEMHIGENFYFGKGAKAGIKELRELAKKYGFKLVVIRPVEIGKRIVSSSVVRKLIIGGDIHRAKKLLGRPVSVFGTVVSGARLARELGYPTANINPHHEAMPPSGVYAVLVRYDREILKGVLNIGFRPTFYSPRDMEPTIEVHIFNFTKRIYGKDLEILFIKKIRDEEKFADKDSLVKRVREDEKIARSILSNKNRNNVWPRA